MNAMKAVSKTVLKSTDAPGAGLKTLRSIAVYSAIAVAVSAGGVLVGAIIVAPAVSRATPFFSGNAQNTESNGSIGQADGDGAASTPAANLSATELFKPIAESIAAAKQIEAAQAVTPVRRPLMRTIMREAGFWYEDTLDAVGRVPKSNWLFVDVALVALFGGLWFYRRRDSVTAGLADSSAGIATWNSAAALPSKLISGKGSRTPKAVAALAQAGTAPADIARRTGLAHDAVAMLLSLGTLNARQLQPPTA
ncbi:MAG: hypothetical protein ABI120_05425 [Gemmatimonadaceae bacterium]